MDFEFFLGVSYIYNIKKEKKKTDPLPPSSATAANAQALRFRKSLYTNTMDICMQRS